MGHWFRMLFSTAGFPARWNCGLWTPALGWLHIVSDLAIFAAYLSIPLALAYFLIRRRDFPYPWLTALFATFILSCGIGHGLEALIFWHPVYRLAGVLKAVTAVVSWATVFAIIRIIPKALELPEITRLNLQLRREIADRMHAEEELRISTAETRRLALVASRTENALILTDATGHIEWVNDGFTRITGYSSQEALGHTTAQLLQGTESDPAAIEYMRERQHQGKGFRTEILNYAKGGREYWVSIEAQPIFDDEGRLIHFMAIETDITERKHAEKDSRTRTEVEVRTLNFQLEQRLLRLDALRQIDMAISASLDLRLTLGIVLDQVLAQLKVDAAAILLISDHDQVLTHASSKGFRTNAIAATCLRAGEGLAGRAILEQCQVTVPDLTRADDHLAQAWRLKDEGFIAYHAVPLMAKGKACGVLEVYHRTPLEPDTDWKAFLETLAGQAAIAIDNAVLFRDLQRSHAGLIAAYDATIEGWARALDLRDKETEGHTRRVTEMTVRLARAMGIDESELLAIRRGSLLHDIGKLGIPDAILLKPGALTEDEWRTMRRHPEYAFEWLAPIATLRTALDIPHYHHEKWDGTGYPCGLKGQQIPLPARIFAAVDIWDALRSDRPYRAAWPESRVLEHLRSLSGIHLDPVVVDAFLFLMTGEAAPSRSSANDCDGYGASDAVSIGQTGPISRSILMKDRSNRPAEVYKQLEYR